MILLQKMILLINKYIPFIVYNSLNDLYSQYKFSKYLTVNKKQNDRKHK